MNYPPLPAFNYGWDTLEFKLIPERLPRKTEPWSTEELVSCFIYNVTI